MWNSWNEGKTELSQQSTEILMHIYKSVETLQMQALTCKTFMHMHWTIKNPKQICIKIFQQAKVGQTIIVLSLYTTCVRDVIV